MRVDDITNLRQFEAAARQRLSSAAFGYIGGGSGDEQTLRDNEAAFSRYRLLPRALVDVSSVDLSTTLLGRRVAMPIGFAPVAQQGLANPDGELIPAMVAAEAGLLCCLSTFANRSIEDVATAGAGLRWFQLYVQEERHLSEAAVARAVAAGYEAIVLTVDLAVPGYRERELRDPITSLGAVPNAGVSTLERGPYGHPTDATLQWSDLAWVRRLSDLPLVVKGILDPADAARAVDHGAAAIVVSNHGGRQLDRSPASIDALEAVVQAVAGRAEVYLDGGVRRGTDVVTALALGARAVFIGRPYVFALAAGGRAGVARCVEILEDELRIAMMLLGAPTVAAITRDRVI